MVIRGMSPVRPAWIRRAVYLRANFVRRARDERRRAVLLASIRRVSVAISAASVLAGCAASSPPPPVVRTVTVQVPVIRQVPCPAPALGDPALPIAKLTPDSSPSDTMRAYAAAVAILKGAVRERDSVLAGCVHSDQAAEADRAEADKPR